MTRIVVRRADRGPDCSLCRDTVVGDSVGDVACPGCGARYHGACLEELATRCATLGCDALRVVARAATRAPVSDGTGFFLGVAIAVLGPMVLVFAASGEAQCRQVVLVAGAVLGTLLAWQGLVVFVRAITPPPRRRRGWLL